MEFQSLTAEGIKVMEPWFVLHAEKTKTHTDALALKDPHYAKFTSPVLFFFPALQNVSRYLGPEKRFVSNFLQKLSVQKTDKVTCGVRRALKPPPAQWHHCRAKVEGGCQRAKYAVIWWSILANSIKLLRWREMEVQEITLDLNVSYLNRSTDMFTFNCTFSQNFFIML